MKKYVIFAAFAALLVACSDDDNNNQNREENQKEFFNLKEGNMWVYKRYQSDNEGNNPVFINITDTVRIVGEKVSEGKEYFEVTHTNPSIGYNNNEYWRVNEIGHLVDTLQNVVHPGKDKAYVKENVYDSYRLNFYTKENQQIIIENKSYNIYPYVGVATGIGTSLPEGEGFHIYYAPEIGIVQRRVKFISTKSYFEDRLVSYDLK